MGVVYEAVDRERGARIALKTLRRTDAKTLYRFKREFRALQGLEHPNLVRLGELVESSGEWFFTMELVDGTDFLTWVWGDDGAAARANDISPSADTMRSEFLNREIVDPQPTFDEPRLRAALAQLAQGVAALHAAGRIHRDIKPSNVLVGPSGRVVLLDFGLVAELDSQSTELHAVGTAAYMAPEQAASKPVGTAADWYSVGVVLYEALTGQVPFSGYGLQVLLDKQRHEPAPPRARVPGLPSDLDSLCVELLRADPAARPNVREILQRIGANVPGTLAAASSPGSEFTQTTPFIGRQSELAQLERAAAAAREEPVLMLVTGESGVGKSELVRRFTEQLGAESGDLVVLQGRCYERESVPYKAFDGVADALSRYLVRLPDADAAAIMPRRAALVGQLFPVLRRVDVVANAALDTAAGVEPQERRARMFAALRELFERLSERHRVVLVIDDFQWADPDSLTLLDDLIHPPDAPPLFILATVRSGPEADRMLARVDELDTEARRLLLGPLPHSDSVELVRRLSPRLVAERPAVAETIAREVDGHPLFLMEMIRHVQDDSATAGAMRLDDALWSRAAGLQPAVRKLLEVLCVAGVPITRSAAADAAQQDAEEVDRAASLLRVAYLARASGARETDMLEPYHDRVREAITGRLDESNRRDLHARVARALARAGADAQLLVRHLEAAGDHARAATHAQQAAETAMRALAFDRAAELYRTALRLGEYPPDQRRGQLLLLARALVNAARGVEAAEVFREASEGADPATLLDCRRQAAEQLLTSGHIERGLDEMEAVLAQVGVTMPRTPRRALLSIAWNHLKMRLRGVRWKQVHEAQVAPELLMRLDVFKSAAHGMSMVDNIRGRDFHTRRLLLALEIGEPSRVAAALAMEAVFVGSSGYPPKFARVPRFLNEAARAGEIANSKEIDALISLARGTVDYFGSRFRVALAHLIESERLARDHATGWELSTARLFHMFCLRQIGDLNAMRSGLDGFLRDAQRRGDTYAATTMRRACAVTVRLADGDPDRGRDDLERAAWVPPDRAFHIQHYYELRARGEIALYEGHAAEQLAQLQPAFKAARASLLMRNQLIRCLVERMRASLLLAAAATDSSRSAGHLAEARRIAKAMAAERIGFAEVFGELIFAGIAMRSGRVDHCVTRLRSAIRAAAANDMELYRAAAQHRLGTIIGGSEGESLIAAADAWLSRERIAEPQRLLEVAAAGFDAG